MALSLPHHHHPHLDSPHLDMDGPSTSAPVAPGAPIILEAPEGRYAQISWITPGSGASVPGGPASAASTSATATAASAATTSSSTEASGTSAAAASSTTPSGGPSGTPSASGPTPAVAPATQLIVSMGALPSITSQSGVPVTTFNPVTPSARLSVVAVRYPRKERERERESGKDGAASGSEANTGSADGSTSGGGDGAGDARHGTTSGPILESTLAAQGIDAPATHMTGGAGGLTSLASSWAWEGGMAATAATNTATQFGAPPAAAAKAKASRPKNSLKQTSSSFVHRVSVHPDLAKILGQRDERDMFSFVNTGKSLMWLADTEGKVKECLARIMFGSHATSHDVNQSTRSSDRLDLIVGFSSGDIVWLDVISMRYSRINKGGCITDSGVTQIRWMPGSESVFLTSHLDGTMLLWDRDREDPSAGAFVPNDVTSLASAPNAAGTESMEIMASDNSVDSSLRPTPITRSRTGSTASSSGMAAGGSSSSDAASMHISTWDPRRFMVVTHPGEEGAAAAVPGGVALAGTTSALPGTKKKETVVWARTNPVSHWKVSRSKINDFAFSPDFPHVAVVAEDGLLRVIDIPAERMEQTFTSYFGALNCLAFSPDGRFLLTGGCDDLVTIWAPREGRIVARCPGHSSFVTALAFDPWRWRSDDTRTYRFASVGEDCKLILWDFSSAALQRPKTHVALAGSSAAARRSSLGSTLSLHGGTASFQQQDPRRSSLSGARAGSIVATHEAIVHAAPARREVAQLQPVLVQQLCQSPATMSDLLVGVRFRPDGIVVLHRSGNVQTYRRPAAAGSIIRGAGGGEERGKGATGKASATTGKRRLPGLSMGIGRTPSTQGVSA